MIQLLVGRVKESFVAYKYLNRNRGRGICVDYTLLTAIRDVKSAIPWLSSFLLSFVRNNL